MGETEREDRGRCPGYDFDALMAWLVGNGTSPEEIRVIECPDCGTMTYVQPVDDPWCVCCSYPLENHLEKAVSLAEYWERLLSEDVLWTGGEA
jgi:hypothetical protein